MEIHSPSATTTPASVSNESPPHGDALGAAHGRLAPAAGHDGGVADEPAAGGEDALGHGHAVHVVGRGLLAHEHDALAPLDGGDGGVGVEVDPAHRGAR